MRPGDTETIRRIAIRAIASVSPGAGSLALKGGNALSVVYGIGTRTSLDLDYSLEGDFTDVMLAGELIIESLKRGFLSAGFHVFDIGFLARPPVPREDWLGGYEVLFKLIRTEEMSADLDRQRRSAAVVGPSQERVFRIQISRHEFIGDTTLQDVDGASILVYSPALIAAEKLRAICQQMPEYSYARHPHPRARDFYDIHAICEEASVDLGLTHK